MDLLKMPSVFAFERDRDDRRREQVVARAVAAHPAGFRTCIAGREIDEAEIGVDRGRLPDRRTALFPGIGALGIGIVGLGPRIGAELARRRDCPEAPFLLAGLGIER